MKKRVMFLIGMIAMFVVVPVFGQDVLPPVPDDFLEIAGRLPELFGSFPGVYVLIIGLIPLLLGLLNLTDASKGAKYALTVVVTAAMTILARFLPFGFLYTATFVGVVLHGAALLVAQILTYAAAKSLLDAAAEKLNPWKPSE